MLENLLVNDAFTNGFPFASGKSWFDGWLWLFAFYEMVVCSWVGLFASFGQKMDTDTASPLPNHWLNHSNTPPMLIKR